MLSSFRSLSLGQKDCLRVLGFGIGYVLATIIPRRFDRWLMKTTTAIALRLKPEKAEKLAARMSLSLGSAGEGRTLLDHARAQYGMGIESAWGRVRCIHRRGWDPEIEIDGLERLRAARETGRGTVLWRMSFGSSLVAKIGLWRADIRLVHLSMEQHGAWSSGRCARRFIAPLFRRSENWYLAERVVIPWTGEPTGVMRSLMNRLQRENAVVSIVGDNPGSHSITTPFLDGRASFAIGAPALAWKVGASLLPLYAVREATNRYRVVIAPAIQVDRALGRKEFVRQAVEEYSQRMQDAVAQHPGSWARWGRFWGRGSGYLDALPPNSRSGEEA